MPIPLQEVHCTYATKAQIGFGDTVIDWYRESGIKIPLMVEDIK